ncbi:hypothetical protein SAMN05216246_10485 [Actinomyces denticolens]|uniref:Uncharacterized protein n=1 Tax=Actinomyces denticolens TaxID=52767 RepID=A0ABY1I7L1_9ACTO|nr:hypothetical protein SAMN05216246_10485 [Actinomyces denticolens]SUU03087.1 Uncharacterised protein [Actinomyces denticolens]
MPNHAQLTTAIRGDLTGHRLQLPISLRGQIVLAELERHITGQNRRNTRSRRPRRRRTIQHPRERLHPYRLTSLIQAALVVPPEQVDSSIRQELIQIHIRPQRRLSVRALQHLNRRRAHHRQHRRHTTHIHGPEHAGAQDRLPHLHRHRRIIAVQRIPHTRPLHIDHTQRRQRRLDLVMRPHIPKIEPLSIRIIRRPRHPQRQQRRRLIHPHQRTHIHRHRMPHHTPRQRLPPRRSRHRSHRRPALTRRTLPRTGSHHRHTHSNKNRDRQQGSTTKNRHSHPSHHRHQQQRRCTDQHTGTAAFRPPPSAHRDDHWSGQEHPVSQIDNGAMI